MSGPPPDCERCPALVKSRRQIVGGRGTPGYIMFIGLGPGEQEDEKCKAFVGPSGHLLRLLTEVAGIRSSDIYLTNAIRCHPAGNRRPKVDEIKACRPFLIEEIKDVAPEVIVTLGDIALQSVYGRAVTLGSVLGQTLTQPETGIPFVPTYHPAFMLRGQWQVADMVQAHLEKARRLADGEQKQPWMGEYTPVTTIEGLRDLRDYLLHPDTAELSFDCETTGLNWRQDEVLCISLATEIGEGFVVPLLSHRNIAPEIMEISEKRVEALRKGKEPKNKAESLWLAKVGRLGASLLPDNSALKVAQAIDVSLRLVEIPRLDAIDSHWEDGEWPEVIAILQEIFASDIKKIGQNALFDVRFLERSPDWPFVSAATAFGFKINGQIEDTLLLHHAVAEAAMPAEAKRTKRSSLTILSALYSDLPFYEEEITELSKGKRRMADVPDAILWEYSGADADAVLRVAPPLRAMAEKEGALWASENIIQPLIRCCWEMEKRGVLVDKPYFNHLCYHYAERIDEAEKRLWSVCLLETRPPWKYLDYKSLQRVLFHELKLPASGRKTDSGRGCDACDAGLCFDHEQTGKDALKAIQEVSDHPILPILLELKELRKAHGTYLDGGSGGFRRHIEADGRIRCQYRVGGAETSRLSSAEPNMQNIPAKVEIPELDTHDAFCRMFVAPEGYGLMTADWSQAEIWGMAYEAGDSGLLDTLTSGQDVHTYIDRAVWPIDPDLTDLEWKEAHADLRRKGKTLIFGIGYGLTDEGIAERMDCSLEEAADIRARYLLVVPSLPSYFSRIRRDIVERGYIENVFGQRRHFPSASLLKAVRRLNDLEGLIREGINYPIQSGCSTLHSAAHIRTEANAILRERQCRPLISVHDSLTFEFRWPDHAYAEQTARIIKALWEDTARNLVLQDGRKLDWQIPVEVAWGPSWGEDWYHLTAKGDVLDVRKSTAVLE